MLQVIWWRRECELHVKGEKKRLRIEWNAVSHIGECSGKETQQLVSGLGFDIIGKILGNLIRVGPHFSRCGSWTRSIWESVRNAESGPLP